jgi:FecR protein
MCNPIKAGITRTLLAILAFVSAGAVEAAEWQVVRSSGEVWIATPEAQPVSLGAEVVLRPGDKIQTGRNGRVLLVRGGERILVAPNSVVGLPEERKAGRATTILQQAGSIVLEVEKQKVEHFEVETPYLAAVVKGTRFAVTVNRLGADVRVLSGTVDVTNFKTGQFAPVSAGQAARVASHGSGGLTLEGSGRLGPIQQGAPRKAALERVPVPAKGLGPPRPVAGKGDTHAFVPAGGPAQAAEAGDRVRIVTPIGLGKLNIQALTNGLARAASSASPSAGKDARAAPTVWGATSSEAATALGGNGPGNGSGTGNGNGSANGNGGANGNGNAYGHGNGKGKAKGKGS